MDSSGIDLHIVQRAHSIDPMALEHRWEKYAVVVCMRGKQEVIYRCLGCPAEKWVERWKS